MKASEYRKRKAEREPIADLTLPSGAIFKVRRPPLQVWITSGKVPQSFVRSMLNANLNGITAEALDPEETVSGLIFLRDAILYAVVEPRLIPGGTGENELDPAELDPEDFEFLQRWILRGSPGVPVLTKEGETTIESLNRFRPKRTGGRPFSPSTDSDEVQPKTEPVAATG